MNEETPPLPVSDGVSVRPAFRWTIIGSTFLIGLGMFLGIVSYWYLLDAQSVADKQRVLYERIFGKSQPVSNRLAAGFLDANADQVADAPVDEKDWIDPEAITFSYVAGKDNAQQEQVWKSLLEQLAEKLGRPSKYLVFEKFEDEVAALKDGTLHVAGLNTGGVPIAVDAAGFVPVSMLGREDGSSGYTMQIIVPAGSSVQRVADLKGKRIHFLWRDSNSGFKAPVVILQEDFGLKPNVDYDYGFSTSHEDSIKAIARGEIDAAPVASDMIDRLAARDGLDRSKIRIIHTSERFPPAALGYSNRIKPEVAMKIRELLLGLSFADTTMSEEFRSAGVTKLVPVHYKEDWAIIRRIDDSLGYIHEVKARPVVAEKN
ncbi:phosphate/phosphite/phosphonate ABC transporter substrate-binding protein [bacterium]|nr:phosphate/phosphite/phosphonate ABC transporter substrate-binding protein [bacterium]